MIFKPLLPAKQQQIAESYARLRPHFDNDSECVAHISAISGVGKSSVRKYGAKAVTTKTILQRAQDNCSADAFVNQIESLLDENNLLEMEEIGQFSKKIEDENNHQVDFTPDISADYELKLPRDKKKEALETLPEAYKLNEQGERWLILPDIHVPFHDSKSLDAVLKYASEIYWDGCLQLGDFMDWDFISRWTKENQRKIEGKRFISEYETAIPVLEKIIAAVRNVNKDAKITMFEGNHDWRIENVVDKTPALEGLIEMETNLRLGERKVDYWRYWTHRRPYIIGKAYFLHGEYIGANHARKTADNFHRNVFYGHTHDRMSFTKTTVSDDSVMCESFGTLSLLELEYMGRKPSNWQQCFAEFFFRGDGNFNHFVTNIIENEFTAINGKRYGK